MDFYDKVQDVLSEVKKEVNGKDDCVEKEFSDIFEIVNIFI